MFIDDPKVTSNMMRVEGGPLGSLGAKIGLCYLSGWTAKSTYEDLSIILKVRNAFAHDAEASDFNVEEIAALCRRLSIFHDKVKFFGGGEDAKHQIKFYEGFKYDLTNHRWGFVAAVGFLDKKFQINSHHPLAVRTNFIRKMF